MGVQCLRPVPAFARGAMGNGLRPQWAMSNACGAMGNGLRPQWAMGNGLRQQWISMRVQWEFNDFNPLQKQGHVGIQINIF
ncbi:MAG: hypothetical protein IPN72_09320 [Saprospiraceae bacterium]|nr:hypothetical protein [Saprospiraceae bacterium]